MIQCNCQNVCNSGIRGAIFANAPSNDASDYREFQFLNIEIKKIQLWFKIVLFRNYRSFDLLENLHYRDFYSCYVLQTLICINISILHLSSILNELLVLLGITQFKKVVLTLRIWRGFEINCCVKLCIIKLHICMYVLYIYVNQTLFLVLLSISLDIVNYSSKVINYPTSNCYHIPIFNVEIYKLFLRAKNKINYVSGKLQIILFTVVYISNFQTVCMLIYHSKFSF